MIAVALKSRSSCAAAIGPRGSNTPACWQEVTSIAAHTTRLLRTPERQGLGSGLDEGRHGAPGIVQCRCMHSSPLRGCTQNAPYVRKLSTTKSNQNAVACQSHTRGARALTKRVAALALDSDPAVEPRGLANRHNDRRHSNCFPGNTVCLGLLLPVEPDRHSRLARYDGFARLGDEECDRAVGWRGNVQFGNARGDHKTA